MTVTNESRAAWAEVALHAFASRAGRDDEQTMIADLIGDLGHLADEYGIDFLTAVRHGVGMWSAEKEDPNPAANHTVRIEVEG